MKGWHIHVGNKKQLASDTTLYCAPGSGCWGWLSLSGHNWGLSSHIKLMRPGAHHVSSSMPNPVLPGKQRHKLSDSLLWLVGELKSPYSRVRSGMTVQKSICEHLSGPLDITLEPSAELRWLGAKCSLENRTKAGHLNSDLSAGAAPGGGEPSWVTMAFDSLDQITETD